MKKHYFLFNILKTAFLMLVFICLTFMVQAQSRDTVVIRNSIITGNWTKPAGVTQIKVELWGGGGGGGRANNNNRGGGGGAGGNYHAAIFTVPQNELLYTVTVGTGGAGATGSSSTGTAGGNSVFSRTSGGQTHISITATGGGGGASTTGGASGNGGSPRSDLDIQVRAASGYSYSNPIRHTGGNGGAGNSNYGAGGGGAAGNAGNGTNGTTAGANNGAGQGGAGDPDTYFYRGGNGGTRVGTGNASGIIGSVPGGGGGGAHRSSGSTTYSGGDGIAGKVLITYTICDPPVVTISNPGICPGSSATITASAIPAGDYDYLWTSGATTQSITVAASGTYTVTVTDNLGCQTTASVILTANTPPAVTATINKDTICDEGSAIITATPEGANYTYIWTVPAEADPQTTASFSATVGGNYTVIVTDVNTTCTATASKTLTVLTNPTIDATIDKPEVCSGDSATIELFVISPNGDYNYTHCENDSATGTYTITVTDIKGCTASVSKTLIVHPLPAAPAFVTPTSVVYDGNPHYATATVPTGYEIIWYETETGDDLAANSITDVGTLTVWAASKNSTTECESASRTEVEVTVTPKELTIGGSFTAHDKPWDENSIATIKDNNLTLTGVVGSDDVTLNNIVLSFDNPNVGENKPVSIMAGTTLGGAAADNYILNLDGAPTATANITICTDGVYNSTQERGYCSGPSSLQNAINDTPNNASGDSLLIPTGTYSSMNTTSGNNFVFFAGASPGCVTITEDMSIGSGDVLVIDIDGLTPCTEYDQYIVGRNVTLGGATLTLEIAPTVVADDGDAITIIDNQGENLVNGTFAGWPASYHDGNNNYWEISYTGGTGNDVTLTAGTPPSFTTYDNIPVNTATGLCTQSVNYTVAASGFPIPTYTYSYTEATTGSGSGTGTGSSFNKGTTVVTIVATNIHGTDVCSFNVIVTDNEAPTITLPANMTVGTSQDNLGLYDCYYTANIAPVYSDNCPGSTTSWVMTGAEVANGTGPISAYNFPLGTTTIIYTVTDAAAIPNTATASMTITVTDNEPPTLTKCADIRMITTTCDTNDVDLPKFSSAPATTTYDIFSGSPNNGIVTDNCDIETVSYQDAITGFYKKTITRTWTITDKSGVEMTCDQTITLNPPCDGQSFTYQGATYDMVLVGTSCWTKQNLKNVNYADNTPIPVAKPYYAADYPDTVANVNTFGRLYSWYSAVNVPEGSVTPPARTAYNHVQGICPDGWYMPENEHYQEILHYGADALKSTNLWLSNHNGNNSTGFTAYPAGYYNASANACFLLFGNCAFWSASYTTTIQGPCFALDFSCPDFLFTDYIKGNGYSVRCVKECE